MDNFSKSEILGTTRQILTEVAAWTDTLFGLGAAERLTGTPPGRDPDWDDDGIAADIERKFAVQGRDWRSPGSAGALIEQSEVLALIAKVTDYLNSNTWQGDRTDFWRAYAALYPLIALLEDNWSVSQGDLRMALSYFSDSALDQAAAKELLKVLKTFAARVHFECDRHQITINELALISGLAEKTVRMAAVGRDRNPDLVTFKDGHMTLVSIDEARRWMASKNLNYEPPTFTSRASLPPVSPTTLPELAPYLRELRSNASLDEATLMGQLGWDNPTRDAYQRLEQGEIGPELLGLSTRELRQLAELLLPAQSRELVLIIDSVLHPIQLALQLDL